jgi:hypothetical protein
MKVNQVMGRMKSWDYGFEYLVREKVTWLMGEND